MLKNDVKKEIEKLVQEALQLAKKRQSNPATSSSDLVASIHGVWIELGLKLGEEMEKIREKERLEDEESQLSS